MLGPMSDVLNKVELEIIDQDVCQEAYNGIGDTIYPGQICAGVSEGEKGFCEVRVQKRIHLMRYIFIRYDK